MWLNDHCLAVVLKIAGGRPQWTYRQHPHGQRQSRYQVGAARGNARHGWRLQQSRYVCGRPTHIKVLATLNDPRQHPFNIVSHPANAQLLGTLPSGDVYAAREGSSALNNGRHGLVRIAQTCSNKHRQRYAIAFMARSIR